MGTLKRPTVLYSETYTKPGLRIKDHLRPTLPSVAAGFIVEEAYILGAGRHEIGGREREFRDIRIYLKEE